uniref:Uncharacterized protein n=1 Tax=Panagrolaimus sp. PS1159 TaxID=55785 RepID=A0AC35FWC3_9BILA
MSFKKVSFKWPLEEPSDEAAFSGLAFPPGIIAGRRSNSLSPKKIIRLPEEKKRLSENFSNISSDKNNIQDINYFPNAYCDDEISQLFEKSEKSEKSEEKEVPKVSKTLPITYRYRIKQYEPSSKNDDSISLSAPKSSISEVLKPHKIERKIPRPLNNPVIIRPRTLKNKRIDFEKLKSPDIDISTGIESIPFFDENVVSFLF